MNTENKPEKMNGRKFLESILDKRTGYSPPIIHRYATATEPENTGRNVKDRNPIEYVSGMDHRDTKSLKIHTVNGIESHNYDLIERQDYVYMESQDYIIPEDQKTEKLPAETNPFVLTNEEPKHKDIYMQRNFWVKKDLYKRLDVITKEDIGLITIAINEALEQFLKKVKA